MIDDNESGWVRLDEFSLQERFDKAREESVAIVTEVMTREGFSERAVIRGIEKLHRFLSQREEILRADLVRKGVLAALRGESLH